MSITIETKVEITEEKIAELFCTAFYGGIGSWAELEYTLPEDIKRLHLSYEDALAKAIISDSNYHFYIIDFENDDHIIINLNSIKQGLQMIAEKTPSLFSEFLEDGFDCIVADRIIQYICFGEEIYG